MAAPTAISSLGANVASGPTSLSPAGFFSGPVAGEVLVVFTYTRKANSAANITGISGGTGTWTEIVRLGGTGGSLAAWWKPWVSGDPTATISYSGLATGTSGDTTLAAQMRVAGADTVAFTGVINGLSTNASQQNIGPITGLTPSFADSAVLVLGGKADDWTSLTDLSGDGYTWFGPSTFRESSTLGADAGLAWAYGRLDGAASAVTSKTMTVTGGAAAAGCGLMFSINATGASAATDRTGRSLLRGQAVNRASTY